MTAFFAELKRIVRSVPPEGVTFKIKSEFRRLIHPALVLRRNDEPNLGSRQMPARGVQIDRPALPEKIVREQIQVGQGRTHAPRLPFGEGFQKRHDLRRG